MRFIIIYCSKTLHILRLQLGFDWRRKPNEGGGGETSTTATAKIDVLQLAKEAEEKKASKGRAATDDETWNTRL